MKRGDCGGWSSSVSRRCRGHGAVRDFAVNRSGGGWAPVQYVSIFVCQSNGTGLPIGNLYDPCLRSW